MYIAVLEEMEIDPNEIDTSENRNKDADPIVAAKKLIMLRCGPKMEGKQGLMAQSTGGAIKSAVVNFWKPYGFTTKFGENPDGTFHVNPGTAPALQELINKLFTIQKKSNLHVVPRATAETHEDVRTICRKYFDPYLKAALDGDSSVPYSMFQSAIFNCYQFGSVSRADELLDLHI